MFESVVTFLSARIGRGIGDSIETPKRFDAEGLRSFLATPESKNVSTYELIQRFGDPPGVGGNWSSYYTAESPEVIARNKDLMDYYLSS